MVTVNSDSKYDAWSKIYNQYWGLKYCQNYLPLFENLLQKYNIHAGSNILDLCCGTGHMVQRLIEQGYQVTGLDISEGMLQYARENAPNAKLILDDARCFNLPSTFHAVICPSGSLNHMMTIADLQQVFMQVHNSLLANGIFLFGLKLEDGYKSWNGQIVDGDVKNDLAWSCYYHSHNPQEKTAEFTITIFQQLASNWQRLDINNILKGYRRVEVISALKNVGFSDINVYDEKGSIVDEQYNTSAIFSCQKQSQ